jgi:hypothetical protein
MHSLTKLCHHIHHVPSSSAGVIIMGCSFYPGLPLTFVNDGIPPEKRTPPFPRANWFNVPPFCVARPGGLPKARRELHQPHLQEDFPGCLPMGESSRSREFMGKENHRGAGLDAPQGVRLLHSEKRARGHRAQASMVDLSVQVKRRNLFVDSIFPMGWNYLIRILSSFSPPITGILFRGRVYRYQSPQCLRHVTLTIECG